MSEDTLTITNNIETNSKMFTNKKEKLVKDAVSNETITATVAVIAPTINNIVINLSSNVEIINLSNGQRHSIMPKANKVKMLNTNLYRIPIRNSELHMDKFHAIKQYAKYAEFFTIVAVANGIVSILPTISGFDLIDNTDIGTLI